MSTGPEHYEEAERLLNLVETESLDDGSVAELLGRALVHATLAQAAAYATAHVRVMDADYGSAWRAAVGRPAAATRSGDGWAKTARTTLD